MPRNSIIIAPHQGLGDHLLCNAIYRTYSQTYRKVFIVVKKKYHKQIKIMVGDVINIRFIVVPNYKSWKSIKIIKVLSRLLCIKYLGLGSYGENFFPVGTRFDKNFYDQAGLNFNYRWSKFKISRNALLENNLFLLLKCDEGPYIFLHEDASRNFIIDRNKIPGKYRIIEPLSEIKEYSLFDYLKILENASEIHVIESSFAALIESMKINIPKYAHRYARPEAKTDYRSEFTYKLPWIILT
jgi:hypothetical protein